MPLTKEHKQRSRDRIVETARILFNRHGFHEVSIDMIMTEAGLTRGGFYNHFRNKSELFAEAVRSFLTGRGAKWRDGAGVDLENLKPETAAQMVESYLSTQHLGDLDGQCPMVALPSDVGRADVVVQEAYQELVVAMTWLFEHSLNPTKADARQEALALTSMCVGAMVLARTLPDQALVNELLGAARQSTQQLMK